MLSRALFFFCYPGLDFCNSPNNLYLFENRRVRGRRQRRLWRGRLGIVRDLCRRRPEGNRQYCQFAIYTRPSWTARARFYISGSAYTNGLWWYKVGTNDAVSHFKMDFWLNVDSTTQYAQALV